MGLSEEEKEKKFKERFSVKKISKEELNKKLNFTISADSEEKQFQFKMIPPYMLVFRNGGKVEDHLAILNAILKFDFEYLHSVPETYPHAKFEACYKVE